MIAAFQGSRGAYSEIAIMKHFGNNIKAMPLSSFEDVFEAVIKGKADYGVIPVENTIAGSVAVNFDLLLKYDVSIINEILLKIEHCLLGIKGNSLQNVEKAFSHPIALDQCRDFLRKHNIQPVSGFDTASASQYVHDQNKKNIAAIASELCAKIYDLDILAKNIQSNSNNITRFFVFVNKNNVPKIIKEKTSIAFKTKHEPGALVNCLQRLAKNNINLTKLESRPIPENPFEYVFFADFEGSIDDEHIKMTLEEMEAASIFIKVLGSYPKGRL